MSIKNNIHLLFFTLIYSCNITYSQIENKPITKLFFEYGFKSCKVSVTNNKHIIFEGILTSKSNSGATRIVEISKLKGLKITLNLCGRTKTINIKQGKFYIISILENLIEVEEVDEEPYYV